MAMAALVQELFYPISDPGITRALFKACVERVMVETSSFCNRRCSYCPNAQVDRLSVRKNMDDALRDKIASNLAEIDFDKTIVMHFYNEPLADERICEQIAFFHAACPKATIEIFSNGDYLDGPYLKRLADAGLSSLILSLHLGNNAQWDDAEILRRLCLMSVKLGIPPIEPIFAPGLQVQVKFPYPGMKIRVSHRNYPVLGSDRAGSVKHSNMVEKTLANGHVCLLPYTELYVAWDGAMVPCCDIHPDLPEHQSYSTGRLQDFPDIFAAFAGPKLVAWRRSLAEPSGYRAPCDTCQTKCHSPETSKTLHDFFANLLEQEAQPLRQAVG